MKEKKRILIVDNSDPMRRIISFALESVGYNVVSAINGLEALKKLERSNIDLIITDINTSGIDGIELIKHVRKSISHKYTPVIMLASHPDQEGARECRQAGVNEWLYMPFTPLQLIETVRRLTR